jgi:hypothetical protein
MVGGEKDEIPGGAHGRIMMEMVKNNINNNRNGNVKKD